MAHPRRWRTLHEITSSNVELHNDVEVVEINKNSVICLKGMEEFEIFSDSVILAEGIEADKALSEKFADLEVETHVIGDAESIGYIEGAIRSGNKVGRLL
jgi:NADH dehydrogenase FAD-containing subunit